MQCFGYLCVNPSKCSFNVSTLLLDLIGFLDEFSHINLTNEPSSLLLFKPCQWASFLVSMDEDHTSQVHLQLAQH